MSSDSYSGRARAAFRRGETAAVARMSRDEVARARAAGDAPAEVEALYMLSRLAVRADDLTEADRLASEALAVAIRAGQRHLEERPRHVLAAVARMSGDLARARELYLDSIALNVALAQPKTVNSEYHNLGFTELRLGNIERAREIFAGVREGCSPRGMTTSYPMRSSRRRSWRRSTATGAAPRVCSAWPTRRFARSVRCPTPTTPPSFAGRGS
ncbi:hypothetical protein GCM10027614_06770 [Micromonospora vulcania]